MYLGQFRDFLKALLETEKESIIESEYRPAITKNNRSTEGSYHRRKVLTIDRQRSHPRVNDKLDFMFHKSSNNYILSLWPTVRLYYWGFVPFLEADLPRELLDLVWREATVLPFERDI